MPYAIAIPLTKPHLTHNVKKLADLDPLTLDPIYDQMDVVNSSGTAGNVRSAVVSALVAQNVR